MEKYFRTSKQIGNPVMKSTFSLRIAILGLLALSALALWMPSTAHANAFFIQEMSGDGMAQGSAVVAAGSKPSNMFQNAANISFLEGLDLEFASTLYIGKGYFETAAGDRTYLDNPVLYVPHIFASYKVNDWLAIGLGGFIDFGLSVKWPDEWVGSHLVQFAGMQSFTINPNISFGPFKGFAFAIGFDAKYGSVEIKRRLTTGLPSPIDDSKSQIHLAGDTWGYGANIGVMYQPADWVRLGLGYRSMLKMAMKGGKAHFDVPVAFADNFPDQKFDATINLPHLLSGGIRFWPVENASIELDVWGTFWSSYDDLKFTFDQGLGLGPNARAKTQIEKQNFRDYIQVRLGSEWWAHEYFALRLGIMLDGGVVPDETVNPMLPDNHRINGCIGIGTKYKGFYLDVAYMLVWMLERDVSDVKENPLPGKYHWIVHDVSFSIGYHHDFLAAKEPDPNTPDASDLEDWVEPEEEVQQQPQTEPEQEAQQQPQTEQETTPETESTSDASQR